MLLYSLLVILARLYRVVDRSAATQLELDVDVFLDFMGELETSGSGEITGDLYMYLLDEYQAGKVRGSNAVSPRRYVSAIALYDTYDRLERTSAYFFRISLGC